MKYDQPNKMGTMSYPRMLGAALVSLFAMIGLQGNATETEIRIRYLTSELVYLDYGKDMGLAPGDELLVKVGGREKARLRVTQVASKSAACEILEKSEDLAVGDPVLLVKKAEPEKTEEAAGEIAPTLRKRERPVTRTGPLPPDRPRKRDDVLRGSVSFQYFGFNDESGNGRDFDQPGLRLNLRGRNFLGDGYHFRVKTRARYQSADEPGDGSSDDSEWRNRIYEASLTFDRENARWHYRVGRILSDKFSGVGYIDGGLLALNPASHSQVGVFAGTRPEWQHSEPSTDLQKYGAYYFFQKGDYADRRFESTLAVAGEYHGGTVSREFAYIRNRYTRAGRFVLYQSAELEINRDWRRDKAGSGTELTNLHAYGRFNLNPKANLTLSFDDRKQYYTYDLRNRDDRYFDHLSRRGWRANMRFKFTPHINFNGSYGLRTREGSDEETSTYMANIFVRNFPGKHWSGNLRVNGFENPLSRGTSGSLGLSYRLGNKGNTLGLSYSNYDYEFLSTGSDRHSEWWRFESYMALARRFFWSNQIEYNLGDDAEGYRFYVELGCRL